MALQVWLPLNKNEVKNQGYENPTITIAGTLTYADGKLGKCLTLQGSNSIYIKIPYTNIGTEMSVCCWVKANSPGDWTDIFSFGKGNRVEKTTTTRYLYYADSNSLIANGTTLFTMNDAVWTHVTMTVDGTNVKFYINGTLFGTYSQINTLSTAFGSNKFFTLGIRTSLSMPYKGYMNDFRIYNHCLSAKEVKEISKGLILHYKLDEVGINENLQPSGTWSFNIANGTRTQSAYENGIYVNYSVKSNSWLYTLHTLNRNKLKAGTKYTVSFDYKSTVSTSLSIIFMHGSATHPISNNSANMSYKPSEGVKRMRFTVTTTDPMDTATGLVIYISGMNVVGEHWMYNLKLEEGSLVTPYTVGNITSNIMYDSSGYCNHGSITGTLTTNNDSPRYTKSTVFNGSSAINAGHTAKVTDAITIAYWAKTSIQGTAISCTESGGFNSNSNGNFYIKANNGYGTVPNCGAWNNNAWHHIVNTFDGRYKKIYKDGALVATNDIGAKYPIQYNASAPIWIGAESLASNTPTTPYFNGSISDVRIYATALSADDVKELYNTSAFVTNNGVFAEYELYEDNLSDVKKTGLLETANFYENGAESGYALDTDKTRVASNYIISEDFIEI